jgi:hypothetical protein
MSKNEQKLEKNVCFLKGGKIEKTFLNVFFEKMMVLGFLQLLAVNINS